MIPPIQRIIQIDPNYPKRLKDSFKTEAPETIWVRGNIDLLPGIDTAFNGNLWALFCSKSGKPVFTFDTPANEALFQLGAQRMEPSAYLKKKANATTVIAQFGGT